MKMIRYPSVEAEEKIRRITGRGLEISGKDYETVANIISDVRTRGDAALIEYTRKFDAPDLSARQMIVSDAEFEAAEKAVDPDFLASLELAADQIESFHKKQLRNSWISTARPGVLLGQLFNPVDAAGVYVPGSRGGMTPLVSSVLMGVIPAKIAGVKHVAMVTPPTKEGSVSPYLLIAAQKNRRGCRVQGRKRLGHCRPGIRHGNHSKSRCHCRARKYLCDLCQKNGRRPWWGST